VGRGGVYDARGNYPELQPWPLHDIVINNIVWYTAYTSEVGGGEVVYGAIVVQ